MARKIFIPSDHLPYHVCNRAHNKESFPVPIQEVWEIMCDELLYTHYLYNLEIHAFVLMSNHYHLIASTPLANLDRCMQFFQTNVAKKINSSAQKINQIFGYRYSRTLIRQLHHYDIAYKYLYRNPVEANLCKLVETYKFSTLQMYMGQARLRFPLAGDDRLIFETDRTLAWLNTKPENEKYMLVKKAMGKAEFDLGVNQKTRRSMDFVDF